jgi:hypothetical protein
MMIVGILAPLPLSFVSSAKAAGHTTVSISATQAWTDTGIDVTQGDSLAITVNGTIFIAGSDPGKTPAGDTHCTASTGYAAPGLPCWSLIGQISNGKPFEVGASKSFIAQTSGRLRLGVNDEVFTDNSGSWNATVSRIVTTKPTGKIEPAGQWVRTINDTANLTIGPATMIVRAYPRYSGDPAISHVNFTALWGGKWHTLCRIPNNRPELGDYYYCSTNLFADGGYPPTGPVKVSFDVYDRAGNVSFGPNGTFTFRINNTFANATNKALDNGGKLLDVTAGIADCVLSGIPDGQQEELIISGTLKRVVGVLEVISNTNTVRIIVKDLKNGQYLSAVYDLSAHYANVPGMSCADAQATIHRDLTWTKWVF